MTRSVKGGGLYGVRDRVDRQMGEVGMGIAAGEEGREMSSMLGLWRSVLEGKGVG